MTKTGEYLCEKTKTSIGSIVEVDIRIITIESHSVDIITIERTRRIQFIGVVEITIIVANARTLWDEKVRHKEYEYSPGLMSYAVKKIPRIISDTPDTLIVSVETTILVICEPPYFRAYFDATQQVACSLILWILRYRQIVSSCITGDRG